MRRLNLSDIHKPYATITVFLTEESDQGRQPTSSSVVYSVED